ncbi:hypothetical protein [Streptomyces iranensis]|uniref:D-alanyl-D-alanine dipeptidase n=1 Tax=Streptomyces iranensis TaxID=576784 RepID=A0ABS4N1V9_9ACTN|nr:hypothetical protein [Streptomyces iranensis]MBP2065977.1 D-alanyl-D-alanine dipeptidase [Streptomyces iranensis]
MTVSAQTPAHPGPGLPSPEPTWRAWPRRWPRWAPHATAVWGVGYAAVQVVWAAAGTTVPWSPHVAYASGVQLALAALALLAAGACLATPRPLARRGRVAVAAVLAVAIPVFAMGMASLPAYVVTLASLSGVESATGFAHVLLNTVGLALLLLVGLSHRRRLRGRCPRCGAGHTGDGSGPLAHPPASVASRRTRVQVYLLMSGLLPWAVVKTIWTLGGDALSVTAEKWREENAGGSGAAKALASVGVDVTVLAALAGIFLLLGLMYPWGQVFPRWTLLLTGRRVPRLLPLLPAWLSAIGLSVYGVVLVIYAPLSATGVLPRIKPDGAFTSSAGITWMVLFGGLAFGGLGFGLIAAARSYAARTRPVCAIAATDAAPGD